MMVKDTTLVRSQWARLRFMIIGPLLASPPEPGMLRKRLEQLAKQFWQHPTEQQRQIQFSVSSIERWYYAAKQEQDPVGALQRKQHRQLGTHPLITSSVSEAITKLYKEHPSWSYQLCYDNLKALASQEPTLGTIPSYSTVRRFMKDSGLIKKCRKRKGKNSEAAFEHREFRSFEVAYVHGLFHLDYHECSRALLTQTGEWKKPHLLCILDDRSRLCCHLQWYWNESTETLVHGFSQAIQKRGMPRSLLSDNGAAMVSAEFTQGLDQLGIIHHTTLPYTPEQNAKQESFWGQIEGRLMPMLEGEKELTLSLLNEATQAWIEGEYNRKVHSEIKESPLERYLRGPSVRRDCPSSERLRQVFRYETKRKQRRSDGTITVHGIRFEIPWRYRGSSHLAVRVARWDLSSVELVDAKTGVHLATLLPLNKEENAKGHRRVIPESIHEHTTIAPTEMAPLLKNLMKDYAATGLPPAYVPLESSFDSDNEHTSAKKEEKEDDEQ